MSKKEINKVVFIGAGRVAAKLAFALKEKGKEIVQVYSRTVERAKALAEKVSADHTDDLQKLAMADIYIVSVTDSAVKEMAEKIRLNKGLIVHTAGAVEMDVLKDSSSDYGVLYPLQTFISDREIDFYNMVPLCIEANNKENEDVLFGFASEISKQVYRIDSEKRLQCHIAAVFANNFTNYMYVIAYKLLKSKGIPFDILKPIIDESNRLVKERGHPEVLTGPAVRKDMETIRKHVELLEKYPELKRIYDLITESIVKNKMVY